MTFLTPGLFLTALIDDPCGAIDGCTYAAQSTGVDVEKKTCQTRSCGLWWRRAFAGGVRDACWRAVRDPIMDQQRYSRVVDEIEGLFGGGVGGHDDDGAGVVRGGGKVGIVHERDMRIESVACCQVKLFRFNQWTEERKAE